ncbi:MAG: hypothetical protein JKY09_00235 [Crocinitomicaceae bacterium]|nr:hypothetical protein [Crocinitomicaceae bacterium]
MNIQETTMTVEAILFESNDAEVLIKGNARKGVMNYDTDIIVSHSQLNLILNLLQKQNTDISVNDYLVTETMYNGETLYSADFSTIAQNEINLCDLTVMEDLKLIRA